MTILRPAAMIGLAIVAMAGAAASQSVDAGVAAGTPAASVAVGTEVGSETVDTQTSEQPAGAASVTEASTSADAGEREEDEGDAILASQLIGRDVYGARGRSIGEIEGVVSIRGEVMALVGVGGFLGIGEHEIALPMSELSLQEGRVTAMGYTRSHLNSMREVSEDYAVPVDPDWAIHFDGS